MLVAEINFIWKNQTSNLNQIKNPQNFPRAILYASKIKVHMTVYVRCVLIRAIKNGKYSIVQKEYIQHIIGVLLGAFSSKSNENSIHAMLCQVRTLDLNIQMLPDFLVKIFIFENNFKKFY